MAIYRKLRRSTGLGNWIENARFTSLLADVDLDIGTVGIWLRETSMFGTKQQSHILFTESIPDFFSVLSLPAGQSKPKHLSAAGIVHRN